MEYFFNDKRTLASFLMVFPQKDHELLKKKFCQKQGNLGNSWYVLPNGKKHGKESGELLGGLFRYEISYLEGKRHGKYLLWNRKRLEYEASYLFGKQHGPQIWYFRNGVPKSIVEWEQGQIHGICTVQRRDSSLKSQCSFRNGKKHGMEIFWNKNGRLVKTVSWDKGEKHGEEILFTKTRVLHKQWTKGILKSSEEKTQSQ